jgi:2-polyprenyl-3-methyl-5-hydroxy-6-metoxy-1,4-benzoquinol methylase
MTAVVSRAPKLRTVARKLAVRPLTEAVLDWARYQLDSRSDPVYQPTDWLPRAGRTASRSTGCETRWDAMVPVIEGLRAQSALDIGCNAGWFTLRLASHGVAALGIENHPPYVRTALYAVSRSGLDNVGIASLAATGDTLALLPVTDVTLLLAVWHHVARQDGLDQADALLEAVWEHTAGALFFETAYDTEAQGLPPMGRDARAWIERHLETVCRGGVVEHLGDHAGAGAHTRDLFVVRRS